MDSEDRFSKTLARGTRSRKKRGGIGGKVLLLMALKGNNPGTEGIRTERPVKSWETLTIQLKGEGCRFG